MSMHREPDQDQEQRETVSPESTRARNGTPVMTVGRLLYRVEEEEAQVSPGHQNPESLDPAPSVFSRVVVLFIISVTSERLRQTVGLFLYSTRKKRETTTETRFKVFQEKDSYLENDEFQKTSVF